MQATIAINPQILWLLLLLTQDLKQSMGGWFEAICKSQPFSSVTLIGSRCYLSVLNFRLISFNLLSHDSNYSLGSEEPVGLWQYFSNWLWFSIKISTEVIINWCLVHYYYGSIEVMRLDEIIHWLPVAEHVTFKDPAAAMCLTSWHCINIHQGAHFASSLQSTRATFIAFCCRYVGAMNAHFNWSHFAFLFVGIFWCCLCVFYVWLCAACILELSWLKRCFPDQLPSDVWDTFNVLCQVPWYRSTHKLKTLCNMCEVSSVLI